MALEKWHCTVCDKNFEVGKWECADGVSNHVVENREYLLDDAPSDAGEKGEELNRGRTRICNIPPDKKVLRNGEATIVPGGYVEFIRGVFSTTDPEIQHYLNLKGGFCTKERWSQVWLTSSQKLEMQREEIRADRQRLENERNELLAKVKQSKEPALARG